MANDAAKLASPFTSPLVSNVNIKGDRDDVYDHNSCPQFSKPHDMSKDTISVVFEEGELGHQFYGKAVDKAAKISGPMNGEK